MHDPQDRRSQASVLAVVLMIGIAAVGSVGLLVLGADATAESRDRIRQEQVEQSFQQLDARADSVAFGDGTVRREVDLAVRAEGAVRRDPTAGRLVVSRTDESGRETLLDTHLGAVVYERDGHEYAYQSGAVWRGSGRGTDVVAPPPVQYERDGTTAPTLTMRLIEVVGDRAPGADFALRRDGRRSPLGGETIHRGDRITIRYTGAYYVGWAEHFRRQTGDLGVHVFHGNETVLVRMLVPAAPPDGGDGGAGDGRVGPGYAIVHSGDGTLTVDGASVNSFHSGTGRYTDSRRSLGGDVWTAGDVVLRNGGTVMGNVTYADGMGGDGTGTVTHAATDGEGPNYAPADAEIDAAVGAVRADNDNDETAAIADRRLQCTECTLTAGRYYLGGVDLDSGELVLDTTDGDITIVVDPAAGSGVFHLGNEVKIRGDGEVTVYVAGTPANTAHEHQFLVEGAEMKTNAGPSDHNATQQQVYLKGDANARIEDGEFVGVVYAAQDPEHTGEIEIVADEDRTELYGAVVGNVTRVESAGATAEFHYDRALGDATGDGDGGGGSLSTTVPQVTFVHVDVYEVSVADAGEGDGT